MLPYKEKGNRLEELVEEIFRNRRYKVQRNIILRESTGAKGEIDVVAVRGKNVAIIECKNYDTKVGKETVNAFIRKMKNVNSIPFRKDVLKRDEYRFKYYFITSSPLTSDAKKELEHATKELNLEYWDGEDLKTQIFNATLGKGDKETISVGNSLPLLIDEEGAVKLEIVNKKSVKLVSSRLYFSPYYVYKFSLSLHEKLPNGAVARINGKGKLVVDAVSGDILEKDSILSGINKNSKILKAIEKNKPQKKIVVGNYAVLPTKNEMISKRTVTSLVKKELKNEYARTFSYETKSGMEKEKTIVPKDKDIIFTYSELIYVPIWSILFRAGEWGEEYPREILATGEVVSDKISLCQKHILHTPPSYGVCDVCGTALCKKHLYSSLNGGFYCWEHLPEKDKIEIKAKSFTSKMKEKGLKIFGRKK